jgi:hypothetical protein
VTKIVQEGRGKNKEVSGSRVKHFLWLISRRNDVPKSELVCTYPHFALLDYMADLILMARHSIPFIGYVTADSRVPSQPSM